MAATDVETVGAGAETAKLMAAAVLLAGGFVAYHMLSAQGVWVQWGAFLVALALSVLLFMLSGAGHRLAGYGKDSWKEVKKVVWPTRREATQMTLYVFAFVLVMALFLWLTDKTLEWVLYDLVLGWR